MKSAKRVILAILLVSVALGLVWLLVIKFPERYIAARSLGLTKVEIQSAENALRTITIQFLGGAALFIGLIFTYRNFRITQESTNSNLKIATATLKLTEDGKLAERFSKAIEQLGNLDNLTSRLGGIYGLERIARDSDADYWPVMEILLSFIRENSALNKSLLDEPSKEPLLSSANPIPVDVQATLSVIARRRPMELIEGQLIDLSDLDLHGAQLGGALLKGANLTDSSLQLANLEQSCLESANLDGTDLRSANLSKACLDNASLQSTHLEAANLNGVHMREAGLMCATLEGADLFNAHLEGSVFKYGKLQAVKLHGAHLEGANLKETNLERSSMSGAYLKGAILTEAVMDDADLNAVHFENAGLSLCSFKRALCSGAYFEKARLNGANLKGADLHFAIFDGADLSGASLIGTELRGASFERADLTHTNFLGSNVTWDQIKLGVNYDRAIVPDHLRSFLTMPVDSSQNGFLQKNGKNNSRLRRRTDSPLSPHPIKDEEYTWRGRPRSASSGGLKDHRKSSNVTTIKGQTFTAKREPNRFSDTHAALMAAIEASTTS